MKLEKLDIFQNSTFVPRKVSNIQSSKIPISVFRWKNRARRNLLYIQLNPMINQASLTIRKLTLWDPRPFNLPKNKKIKKKVQKGLRIWNKEEFGYIGTKIKLLKKALGVLMNQDPTLENH